jgi:hypothetical protein
MGVNNYSCQQQPLGSCEKIQLTVAQVILEIKKPWFNTRATIINVQFMMEMSIIMISGHLDIVKENTSLADNRFLLSDQSLVLVLRF